ncbi:hypothetical protein [Vreelandella sp. TE19]
MKYQKEYKQVDERDKLRKFRELDDAFAQALRQLENPDNSFDIPTGPPVRSLKDLEEQDEKTRVEESERLFGERLKALCIENGYSEESVKALVEALVKGGRWTMDETPSVTQPTVEHSLSGSDKPAG